MVDAFTVVMVDRVAVEGEAAVDSTLLEVGRWQPQHCVIVVAPAVGCVVAGAG